MTGTPGLGQVHATQDQLNRMAQRCEDTGQNIATGMARLVDRIQALSGGGLNGTANVALQDVSAQLNDGLTKIINALGELRTMQVDEGKMFGVPIYKLFGGPTRAATVVISAQRRDPMVTVRPAIARFAKALGPVDAVVDKARCLAHTRRPSLVLGSGGCFRASTRTSATSVSCSTSRARTAGVRIRT